MLLVLDQVRKRYGATVVLRDVSLQLAAGECCRVHGANGSGKSTLLRLAAGVSLCDSGRIERAGSASYVGHDDALLTDCTVSQNLSHLSRLDPDWHAQGAAEHLQGLGLAPYLHTRIRVLSQGTRRKVSLLLQLGSAAALMLADEPFAGLDVPSVEYVRSVYRTRLAQGGALLWTHHGADALDAEGTSLQLGVRGA